MAAAHLKTCIDFDGALIHLLPDLSRQTLALHRAVEPVLVAPKTRNIPNARVFHFKYSSVTTVRLIFIDNLPSFVDKLNLPLD